MRLVCVCWPPPVPFFFFLLTIMLSTLRSRVSAFALPFQLSDRSSALLPSLTRLHFHSTALPVVASSYVESVVSLATPSDLVVDATCGNGHDTLLVAASLRRRFPSFGTSSSSGSSPTLLAIDINPLAIDRTTERLGREGFVPSSSLQFSCRSHAPLLPLPRSVDTPSLLLAIYNLGYLPNNPAGKDPSSPLSPHTAVPSTLHSLASAASSLRVGGALLVTSYPGSNRPEHDMVLSFVTALARRSFVGRGENQGGTKTADAAVVLQGVEEALITIDDCGDEERTKKTFRAYSTKPLGREDSPTLTVCERIK